nr:hypothetical protein Iba_chr02cCG9040 [Ipomoea batatas]
MAVSRYFAYLDDIDKDNPPSSLMMEPPNSPLRCFPFPKRISFSAFFLKVHPPVFQLKLSEGKRVSLVNFEQAVSIWPCTSAPTPGLDAKQLIRSRWWCKLGKTGLPVSLLLHCPIPICLGLGAAFQGLH